MEKTITASIDVTKIDKARLFQGKKGNYLNLALIPSPNNEYGNDFMIVQSVTKEERDAGKKGNILGNARYPKRDSSPAPAQAPVASNNSEDVPF